MKTTRTLHIQTYPPEYTNTHTKYMYVYTYNWYSQCTTALFIVVCWCCSHHKWIDLYGSDHKMTQFIYAMGFCFNLIASIFIFSLLWLGYGVNMMCPNVQCPLYPINIHVPLASHQGYMQTTCDNEMPFEQMNSISAFRNVLISVGDSHVLFCLMDFSSLRKKLYSLFSLYHLKAMLELMFKAISHGDIDVMRIFSSH